MSNKPQVKTEEIELIPHAMDAWRAALDLLIACAPGDGPAIAAHLGEASKAALVCVNRTGATQGVAQMVDRLMLIGAGRIIGVRLDQQQNELGFTHHAPSMSLTRRVTKRLTVVVNGNDYDVSAVPGVLVGDMLRVDPNNLPPLLNRDWGFSAQPLRSSGYQSLNAPDLGGGKSCAAVDQPHGASAPLQQGAADSNRQFAHECPPAAADCSAALVCSATHPARETPLEGHQLVPAAPQHPDRS